jgi:hypothetical protein
MKEWVVLFNAAKFKWHEAKHYKESKNKITNNINPTHHTI